MPLSTPRPRQEHCRTGEPVSQTPVCFFNLIQEEERVKIVVFRDVSVEKFFLFYFIVVVFIFRSFAILRQFSAHSLTHTKPGPQEAIPPQLSSSLEGSGPASWREQPLPKW